MRTTRTTAALMAWLLMLVGISASAGQVNFAWQRLLSDPDASLRLKDATIDGSGRVFALHTVRIHHDDVMAGSLALWRVTADGGQRAFVELPAGHGDRDTATDVVLLAGDGDGDGDLAVLVKTDSGLSLLEIDPDTLQIRDASHRPGVAEPVALLALGDGVYQVVTSEGVLLWRLHEEPDYERRFDSDSIVVAATRMSDGLALLVARRDALGGYLLHVGVHRTGYDKPLPLRALDADVKVLPGRTPFFATASGAVLFYPLASGPPSRWQRLTFDGDMNLLARDVFELPEKASVKTSLAVAAGKDDVLLAGGKDPAYWVGDIAGVIEPWSFGPDRISSGHWEFSMDLVLVPAANDGPVLAATLVYPDADTKKVVYAIHIARLTFEDGGDTHAAGRADGN